MTNPVGSNAAGGKERNDRPEREEDREEKGLDAAAPEDQSESIGNDGERDEFAGEAKPLYLSAPTNADDTDKTLYPSAPDDQDPGRVASDERIGLHPAPPTERPDDKGPSRVAGDEETGLHPAPPTKKPEARPLTEQPAPEVQLDEREFTARHDAATRPSSVATTADQTASALTAHDVEGPGTPAVATVRAPRRRWMDLVLVGSASTILALLVFYGFTFLMNGRETTTTGLVPAGPELDPAELGLVPAKPLVGSASQMTPGEIDALSDGRIVAALRESVAAQSTSGESQVTDDDKVLIEALYDRTLTQENSRAAAELAKKLLDSGATEDPELLRKLQLLVAFGTDFDLPRQNTMESTDATDARRTLRERKDRLAEDDWSMPTPACEARPRCEQADTIACSPKYLALLPLLFCLAEEQQNDATPPEKLPRELHGHWNSLWSAYQGQGVADDHRLRARAAVKLAELSRIGKAPERIKNEFYPRFLEFYGAAKRELQESYAQASRGQADANQLGRFSAALRVLDSLRLQMDSEKRVAYAAIDAKKAGEDAEEAKAEAGEAKTAATLAHETANNAQNAANIAQSAANTALSAARTAENVANDAQQVASRVEGKADDAVTKANQAKQTAESVAAALPLLKSPLAVRDLLSDLGLRQGVGHLKPMLSESPTAAESEAYAAAMRTYHSAEGDFTFLIQQLRTHWGAPEFAADEIGQINPAVQRLQVNVPNLNARNLSWANEQRRATMKRHLAAMKDRLPELKPDDGGQRDSVWTNTSTEVDDLLRRVADEQHPFGPQESLQLDGRLRQVASDVLRLEMWQMENTMGPSGLVSLETLKQFLRSLVLPERLNDLKPAPSDEYLSLWERISTLTDELVNRANDAQRGDVAPDEAPALYGQMQEVLVGLVRLEMNAGRTKRLGVGPVQKVWDAPGYNLALPASLVTEQELEEVLASVRRDMQAAVARVERVSKLLASSIQRIENRLADQEERIASTVSAVREEESARARLDSSIQSLGAKLTDQERRATANLTEVKQQFQNDLAAALSKPRAVPPDQLDDVSEDVAQQVLDVLAGYGYTPPKRDRSGSDAAAPQPPTDNAAAASELYGAGMGAFFSRDAEQLPVAVGYFSDAVAHNPQEPVYRYYLALSLYRQGRIDEATAQVRAGRAQETPVAKRRATSALARVQGQSRMWLEKARLGG